MGDLEKALILIGQGKTYTPHNTERLSTAVTFTDNHLLLVLFTRCFTQLQEQVD